jgi:ribose-phosphate pyrophosphokinase
MKYEQIRIFCGNANPALTADVCECLGMQPGLISARTFADGELQVQILENVRGVDAFAVQPTCNPVCAAWTPSQSSLPAILSSVTYSNYC